MAWFLVQIICFPTFYPAIGFLALLGQPVVTDSPSPLWTNWTQCSGRCRVKMQMRQCLHHCGENKLEVRQCSTNHILNCKAYKVRISPYPKFWSKVKLEINISSNWAPFCHSAWDICMADEVCRIQGFPEAEAALQGDKLVGNDSCVSNQENNNTCDFFEQQISSSCYFSNEAVAVCKVPVSIYGSHTGIILFPFNGTLQTMSIHGWNIKGAEVVCRELGFKRAIAPFSTNENQTSVTSMCIVWINCSGDESSLSFCAMNYTTKCIANAAAFASVTCDPNRGLLYQFRKVIPARLGKNVNVTCDLSNEKPYWCDVNGQRISERGKLRYQVSISGFKTQLILLNLTLENGGVYFCNGTRHYGSLIIYVQAPPATTRRISLKRGQTRIIDCNIYGVPKPMVTTWWKDGKPLYDSAFLKNEKNSLIIQNATIEDAGSYDCKTVQVYELGKREQKTAFDIEVNDDYDAGLDKESGNCTNFSCEGGQHCNATKDGAESLESRTNCNNSNDQGQETPNVYIETENMTFNVGDEVNLLCEITNSRLFASAKWIREETKQILRTANFSYVENSTSFYYHRFSHIIDKVFTDDAGSYTCVVTYDGNVRQRVSYKLQVTDVTSQCLNNPCNHEGICISTSGGYTCECPEGKGGVLCSGKEKLHVYIVTENVTFVVEERVNLVCKIEKKEVFIAAKWIREQTKQTLETANFSGSDANSKYYHQFHYEIKQVSTKDKGIYKCVANFYGYGPVEAWYNLQVKDNGSAGTNSTAVIILSLLSGILCLGIIGYFVYHKRRVSVQKDNVPCTSAENWELEGTISRWEIPSQQINLRSVLGSGTFGEVWKAVVWGLNGYPGHATVAVKKLKHNSSDTEKESLAQEIELGRSLDGDRHPNIVNFLGCVSASDASLMLLLEYAPYGDLLGYLRKSRGLEDKYYSSPECCRQEVTPYDLVSFSQQIASGMSFLASKKILHRDLAARNILLGEGRTCKITDFGLALLRDKQHLYCTTIRKGRLPIKWTAPEHLFNDCEDNDIRVSEKSDVVRAEKGIARHIDTSSVVGTCENIVAPFLKRRCLLSYVAGGLPYPGWGEWKVVYELKVNKYRMDQPDHVSDDIYQIMLDCWQENPDLRPTFERLYQITTGLLEAEHYLDLDMSKYEAHLYSNVEELEAAMGHANSLETRGLSDENVTVRTEHQDSRL